ncbi:DNA binding nuclease [Balamuthia mandrillaris]
MHWLLWVAATLLVVYAITAAWCKRRRKIPNLGPSRFAEAVGIHPYTSREMLWEQMTGIRPPPTESEAMRWGILNEPKALEIYSICKYSLYVQKECRRFSHPQYPWLVGIPDALVFRRDGYPWPEGVVEVKCPWNRGDTDTAVPHQTLDRAYYYIPQIQGYMELCNTDYCDLCSFTPKGTNILRFRRDRRYWALVLEALKDFREDVVRNRRPKGKHPSADHLQELSVNMQFEVIYSEDGVGCFDT